MDLAVIRARVQATLDANSDVRRQAELDLKFAEEQPGFPNALLDILETETDAGVNVAAVIYLKNRVNRGWPTGTEFPNNTKIPEEEKARFRQRLLPILSAASPLARAQLIPIVQKILHYDFPERWPNFIDITLQLLAAPDANQVLAGLQCLLATCKVYRYKAHDNRADFDKIVTAAFPQLLTIGNGLLEETSNDAGAMLQLVMKAYKHAIQFELPLHLKVQDSMVAWCSLFLRVVAKDPPPDSLCEELDEREKNPWWKAKKWAYANLNKLFVRYGNPNSLGSHSDDKDFSKNFITNFAPEIFKAYLQEIEKWVAKTTWLSKPCLSFTLLFLEQCIKPKSTWALLRPHIDTLISHFIFPILCQSDEDIELFESDPTEYLHRKLNCYEEVSAPDIAATTFLTTMTKSRKIQTYPILSFVNNMVNKYQMASESERNPREKEGALRMIGTLSSVILAKNSPIADQIEFFFVSHVFPEFKSPHGFLRARACDTVEKFESLPFQDERNLIDLYTFILRAMADPELPVRVEAALALHSLIQHDIVKEAMRQNIAQIMQQLLKLANEVDVDNLANVMEQFVEVFAPELTPFAVALTDQLRDTYLRIIREMLERLSDRAETDLVLDNHFDDKSITALGVLQTIGTLILTLESTPDVLLRLEESLMPIISVTLDNKLCDLYNEIFEIIDSCTFSAKIISPFMWQSFELMHKAFKTGAELYLEDMLPALGNFVQFGAEALLQTRSYLEAMVDMVHHIFQDDKVGGMDRVCGCKLAESLMLHLRGSIDEFIPRFVELAMMMLTNSEPKVKVYRVYLMEMVINAIYYNPALALQVLEAKGWTNKFFSLWFSNIDNFTRVHDKKLSIGAIVMLLSLKGDSVPISVQQGWPRLLQGIVRLFQTLPAAMKNREDATQDDFEADDVYDEGDQDEWDNVNDWDGNEVGEQDVADENQAYIDFLNEEASKFGQIDDDDDELEEEGLLETPLDKLEPYTLFSDVFFHLQKEQPALYEKLTEHLNPDEQSIVRGVLQQGETYRSEANAAAGGPLAQQGQQQQLNQLQSNGSSTA